MRRFFLAFAAMLITVPSASQSLLEGTDDSDLLGTNKFLDEYQYDEHIANIADQFQLAGCNEYDVRLVAELDEEAEEVYVAWCAAADNYFMVMICKFDLCNILRKVDDSDGILGGDGLGGFGTESDMENLR
jgi:hypothetical protein